MPVNIPPGFGLAQLRFIAAGLTRESLTTFGYEVGDPSPAVNAQIISEAFTQSGRPFIGTQIQEGWSFLGVRVTEMKELGPATGEFSDLIDGVAIAGAMPPNCAVLIRKTTTLGGRRNRGRMFVPPVFPGETQISPTGIIADPQLDQLQTWWSAALTALQVAGVPPVILHSEPPFTPSPITAWVVQDRIATQRRRLRK